ncbi:MAG: PH domain-containing protein [Caldilineaceae bacterium]
MQRDDVRKAVTAQFYQSLSESGVQITALPQNQLQAVVNALADGVFAAMAAVEAQTDTLTSNVAGATRAAAPQSSATPNVGNYPETLLWRGRPYLTLGTVYELTSQRLRVLTGMLTNNVDEVELIRVHDTQVKQHIGERMLNVGDIHIFADDNTSPELVLNNVQNPMEVRELIRKAVLEERARRGLTYREMMR